MRNRILFNDGWKFTKENIGAEKAGANTGEPITLPHTWNAEDGQDGGNDFFRGVCWYSKEFARPQIPENGETWLEFGGASTVAEVFLNGEKLARHEGGYSTFRVNITKALADTNMLAISVDNTYTRKVYPQKADFTFYGGIYRDVYLLTVPEQHFALGYFGGSGLRATPKIEGDNATVLLEAWTENTKDGTPVRFTVENVGTVSAATKNGKAEAVLPIADVHLWDGISDPFLYTLAATLPSSDAASIRFGCRSFAFDAEKGFFLNGRSYPLCGAARHQDWQGLGSAISIAEHKTDMQLLQEMGANTLRLAHYQHSQIFYDLADEAGMVVWAEIPYITEHMPEARENTISQMTELVVQNYNHPSIICWGLSNEITTAGGVTDDLVDNAKVLNDLCHKLDATRPTAMANVFMLENDSPLQALPDIRSYNLYYGWYVGELEDNDAWFDDFHAQYPDLTIGLSEYGADANPKYQSPTPQKGDYTESYQAIYHEHMLKMWKARPYIWAMHVWNMFDFAADGREEGGKPGINQKGLVTFDRKIKKDAFYIYKAYLSKEPFLHICGRRYIDRPESTAEIKVYSNQPTVALFVDGVMHAQQSGDKVFCFDLPIHAKHEIVAKSGALSDTIHIQKVSEPNPEYIVPGGGVTNWFDREDMEVRTGYYSIKDSMGELKKSPEAMALLAPVMAKAVESYGDVAKNVKVPESMQKMMDAMPLESTFKQASKAVTPEMIVALNKALTQIPKQ